MDWDWAYLLTSFEGRINRAKYWGANIAVAIIAILIQWVLASIIGFRITAIIGLVFLYPAYAVTIKRGNDRDRPAWITQAFLGLAALSNVATAVIGPPALGQTSMILTLLSGLLMLGGLYMLVDFGCLRGTEGPNSHGPDPLAAKA